MNMNIMPMDYYPMPADANSQIKNLEEEKSRLNEKRQTVDESGLSNTQKEKINGEIESKTDNVKNLIRRQNQRKAQKDKMDKADLQKKRETDNAVEKQAVNTGTEYRRFDKKV